MHLRPDCRRNLRANIRIWTHLLFLALFATTVLTGCAGQTPPVQTRKASNDDFFKKWKIAAESAEGHSPGPPVPFVEEPVPTPAQKKQFVKVPEPPPLKIERPLPTQKVSLRMHNADVVVVLRTLARAVSQNIVMNDKVKGTISIEMDGVAWDEAFRGILRSQGLTYVWEGDLIRVLTFEDMETELKINALQDKQKMQKKEAKQAEPLAEPLVLRVVPIDYAKPKDLQEMLKGYLTVRQDSQTKDEKGAPTAGGTIGSISVDEHTNSLVINAIPADINRLIALIQELDKPTSQILIESNIVEATKDVARGLGVQWGGFYSSDNLAITPGGTSVAGTTTYTPSTGQTGIGQQGFGANFPIDLVTGGSGAALGMMFGTIGGNILDMQLQALQKEGKVNILSSPSITTLDNQKAFTENGAKVPYVSTSQLSGTEVKFIDAVLRLEIKPHVISADTLKMEITVKKDEVDPTRNVQGNPYIIKKQTETTLIAKDGETIVISGLTRETATKEKKGLPGVKDAPLVGWLFRSTQTDKSMEEVLIFITPHILKPEKAEERKMRLERMTPKASVRNPSR